MKHGKKFLAKHEKICQSGYVLVEDDIYENTEFINNIVSNTNTQ